MAPFPRTREAAFHRFDVDWAGEPWDSAYFTLLWTNIFKPLSHDEGAVAVREYLALIHDLSARAAAGGGPREGVSLKLEQFGMVEQAGPAPTPQ